MRKLLKAEGLHMANILDQLLPSMGEKTNKKRKSGLEISFPVSAYQHETSASAVAAPTDTEHRHRDAAAHTSTPLSCPAGFTVCGWGLECCRLNCNGPSELGSASHMEISIGTVNFCLL